MKKSIAIVTLLLWLAVTLPVGMIGIAKEEIAESITNASLSELKPVTSSSGVIYGNEQSAVAAQKKKEIDKFSGFLSSIPSHIGFMLTACAFGALGALIHIIRQISQEGKQVEDTKYISGPVLGLLTGVVVLGLFYILPTLLVVGENNSIRPSSLMFLCLFAGMFARRFYTRLSQSFDQIFKSPDKQKTDD